MSRAAASVPLGDLGPTHRPIGRRGLLAAALVAIAALAVALAFALAPSSGPGVLWPLGGSTHAGRLSVSVPRGFYVYPIPGGHVLTNYQVPPKRVHKNWIDVFGEFGAGTPPGGVALALAENLANDHEFGHVTDRLRLPLSSHQPWYRAPRTLRVTPRARSGDFQADNTNYYVMYWLGPTASAHDRLAVLRVLRSIRPTR